MNKNEYNHLVHRSWHELKCKKGKGTSNEITTRWNDY